MKSTNRTTVSWVTNKFDARMFKAIFLEDTFRSAEEKVSQVVNNLSQHAIPLCLGIELSEHEIPLSGGIQKSWNIGTAILKLESAQSVGEPDLSSRSYTCNTKARKKLQVDIIKNENKRRLCIKADSDP